MKKLLLSALTCAMLFTTLAGCNGDDSVSSAASLASEASSEVSEQSSEVESSESSVDSTVSDESAPDSESSVLESESSLAESDVQTSSGFGVPDDSDGSDDTGYVVVPGTSVGESDFQTEFNKNTIDETYNEDMQNAASQSKVQEIIMIAMTKWENAVSTAYEEALNSCANETDKAAIRTEQEEWVSTLDKELQALRDAAADGLTGEYQAMLYYRTRTAELLSVVYENTGSFNLPDGEARGAG